jgi:hypothetical protein
MMLPAWSHQHPTHHLHLQVTFDVLPGPAVGSASRLSVSTSNINGYAVGAAALIAIELLDQHGNSAPPGASVVLAITGNRHTTVSLDGSSLVSTSGANGTIYTYEYVLQAADNVRAWAWLLLPAAGRDAMLQLAVRPQRRWCRSGLKATTC